MSLSEPSRDKEAALLQELWKAAARQGRTLEIPCKTEVAAIRRRFTFYNAVSKVKRNPDLDFELAEAVRKVMIFFKPGDKTTLCLGKKDAPDDLMKLAMSYGVDVSNLGEDALDREAAESQRRLLEKIAGGGAETSDLAPLTRPNPYYTRER